MSASLFKRMQTARLEMKRKLRAREWVNGTWTSIPHPAISEILAKSGLDFIGLDIEHGTHEFDSMQRIFAAIQSEGLCALARVPSPDNFEMMRRVLDHGADGIIAPMIEKPEQVEALLQILKFPPTGNRSYGVNRAQGYGFDFKEYVESWNASSLAFIQIESIQAAESIDRLVAFPELDGVMIGLYDLSGSLGRPGELEHPSVRSACEKIIKSCVKAGKSVGTHFVEVDQRKLKDAKAQGYSFSIFASDIFILWKWAESIRSITGSRTGH